MQPYVMRLVCGDARIAAAIIPAAAFTLPALYAVKGQLRVAAILCAAPAVVCFITIGWRRHGLSFQNSTRSGQNKRILNAH
ncbi:hypothetical protein [Aurantiacibacter marinus]|uniref:hypothetical protein n=1 Tax=Aurantiacibacter marinus TaxID=874156 RepID=UPI0012E094EB|nr:hypothetical protein [Aurantiacibacter marinus]